MSTRRIVAVNTASQLVGKFLSAGTVFLVSFLVARNFGANGFGEFTKITTYVAFFFLVADFGLNAIFLQQKTQFSTLLSLRVVGGLLLIFLSLAILAFIPYGQSQGYTGLVRLGIILFSPTIFFQGLITTANAIFQKELRYDLATVAIGAGSVVTLLVLLLVSSPVLATVALLLGSVATAAVALVLTKKIAGSFSLSFDTGDMMKLFMPAVPLGLTLFFNLVYFHADSVILTLTRSTAEVGIYGLAFKAFEVPLVLPTFFMNAVYPLMLTSKNHDFTTLFKKSFLFLLLTSFSLVLVMWFAAPLLTFIREDFVHSIAPLRILSLGLPFFFVSSLIMWTFIARKKQHVLAIIYGVLMVFNILLNMWFIPLFGFMAAAWITVLSEGIVLLVSSLVLLPLLSQSNNV